jgi:hypothetical protein
VALSSTTFYANPGDELVAVRRAAARAGCQVKRLTLGPARIVIGGGVSALDRGDGPSAVVSSMMCRDGWQAARLLLALAIEDARTPGARRIADELRKVAPSDEDFARAVHSYVATRIRFVREQGEIFQSGSNTLNRGAGDCDDMFRLVYALAVAGGLDAKLGVLHHGADAPPAMRGPTHAVALLCPHGRCDFAETTVAAAYGEEPNDAARRLGLTNDRTDIAREVLTMTEADLPPLPDGFRDRNDPAQVAVDCEALQRLGFLNCEVEPATLGDPTDPLIRQAVAAFQKAHRLVADGLLGPTTRLTIAQALREAGTEGFDYPGLSGLDDAPPVKVTGDLTQDFLLAVRAMALRFRARGATATAEDWLRVWLNESGINSHRPNGAGAPYYGLNQMGVKEQAAAGFLGTPADWLALSNEDQLPYVERFYVNAIRNNAGGDFSVLDGPGAIYVATFAPAFMRHASDPAFPLYSAPTGAYNANKGFDRDPVKGFITPADLARTVAAFDGMTNATGVRWREVKARVAALGEATPSRSLAGVVAGAGIFLAALGGAWWATR